MNNYLKNNPNLLKILLVLFAVDLVTGLAWALLIHPVGILVVGFTALLALPKNALAAVLINLLVK